MTERQEIEQAMVALEAHREKVGDEVIEVSLAALRQRLTELEGLDALSSALKGERKQVTVMFADISGFTALSEKLDPEEVRSLINACFERLGEVIDRYDGHIDKFIGDEIMALFGAPIAHENDPERALRAALDMMETLAKFNAEHAHQILKPLALHFGVNSGLVIAGGIGTSQRQDYSVIGDTVNLASRLEALSEAGEILVGEDTCRRARALFEFEALKPVRVKGKEHPVRAYRLLKTKAVSKGQGRGIEGLYSPLVGRDNELARLNEALVACNKGQGGVVSIIGEAGLGKSRLIAELRLMHALGDQPEWAAGRALSYGESASYLVARDVLRSLLGVNKEASPAETELALRAELDQLLPDQAIDIYPYLAHLLEVPLEEVSAQRIGYLEGEALHQRVQQSVQNYILAKAAQVPLVLVWDDLHWADPSSLELIEALLPLTRRGPLLLHLVYRPIRDGRIWTFHQKIGKILGESHTTIELTPLTLAESNRMLENLLGNFELPDRSRQLILTKAEGNPFFLEEVIRSLIDSGAVTRSDDGQNWVATAGLDDIKIPDTLQGVIMARIDRLDPETKRLLQVASVIGRDFPFQVLGRVMERATFAGRRTFGRKLYG